MTGRTCKCGCGRPVPRSNKAYVDKAHQIAHLMAGEASRLNTLQPIEAKQSGGHTAGSAAVASGRLAAAGRLGSESAKRVAREMRDVQESTDA